MREHFKRYGPELLEQLPHLPHKLMMALDTAKELSNIVPDLQRTAESLRQQNRNKGRNKRRILVSTIAAAAALFTALPVMGIDWHSIPTHSWLLGGIALWAWVSK